MSAPPSYIVRRVGFWMLAVVGVAALLMIVSMFWLRPTSDKFELALAAIAIAGIIFSYLMHERELDKVRERAETQTVTRLSMATFSMGLLGFLALMMMHSLLR